MPWQQMLSQQVIFTECCPKTEPQVRGQHAKERGGAGGPGGRGGGSGGSYVIRDFFE